MKSMPTLQRFLPGWAPQQLPSQAPGDRTEPVLGLAPVPTLPESLAPQLRWADIERVLDEGSHRNYQPRGESEVIEKPRRR
ncbi:MAG: hypothetical protein EOP35_02280 [Rubrivivax sp.]|nr:MAG: hypothetical protein EOP35_02280 [Rubrivivax sp.]